MTLPSNFNKKLGYYKLGSNEYECKTEALLASSQNKNLPHVEFVFNNDFFSSVKWQQEPVESLTELYKQRAQQLREKYNYIIISYTGGSDSWNMLNAFLANGIRVDEIVHSVPLAAVKNLSPDNTNYSPDNYWSEYFFVTKPDLEKISKDHPEIKITISDWSEQGDKFKLEQDWQLNRSASLTPQMNRRWSLETMTNSIFQHKNVGHIVGMDKPRICYKDNKFWIYFLDFVSHSTVDKSGYINDLWTTEFFYWAPEAERILRKQCHTIKNFFKSHSAFLPYITWPTVNPIHRQFYENTIKGLIYPEYDLKKFQVLKPPSIGPQYFGYEQVLRSANPNLYKDWQGGVNEFLQILDSRYIRNGDITGFSSGFYEI